MKKTIIYGKILSYLESMEDGTLKKVLEITASENDVPTSYKIRYEIYNDRISYKLNQYNTNSNDLYVNLERIAAMVCSTVNIDKLDILDPESITRYESMFYQYDCEYSEFNIKETYIDGRVIKL
jgi:hypothetical protein